MYTLRASNQHGRVLTEKRVSIADIRLLIDQATNFLPDLVIRERRRAIQICLTLPLKTATCNNCVCYCGKDP